MTCRDFADAWNARIDVRGELSTMRARAVDRHARECPACRALGLRYLALSQALDAIPPLTGLTLPDDFADRVLAAVLREETPSRWRIAPRVGHLAAAAAVLAALTFGLTWKNRQEPARPSVEQVRAIDSRDLSEALADAGTATWDLAREASGPAARVGRQVLGSSDLVRATPAVALPIGLRPTAEVWRGVEDRVSAGVRPLEGSARHAFGFLLGESSDEVQPPLRPAKGA